MTVGADTMLNSDFLAEVYVGLSDGEYGWICSFTAPPDQGEWAGRFYTATNRQAAIIDATLDANNYFCTAVLSGVNEHDKMARSKATFSRLAVLVVDDVDPDSLLGGFSYSVQTSPGKFQVGIFIDQDDPDCRSLPLVDAVMAALSARGKLGGNDSSGNAAVRYCRLPYGKNTKPRPAGIWDVRLETWAPSVRWSLADACEAVGVNLDSLRAAVERGAKATNTTGSGSAVGSVAGDALAMLSAPLDQRSYHDSLIRMAASLVAGGMYPGAAVEFLYSLMDRVRPAGPPEEVARWQARRAEIPRAVKSAEKFAPPDRAPAQITVNLRGANGANGANDGANSGANGANFAPAPIDWEVLERQPPEPAVFVVPGWLPLRTTTLLSANGGVGKSNLALQLAVALSAGAQWLGMDVVPSRVLVISAEDEARTVHFRVANICADMDIALSALADRLVVYDMAQADCVMWGEHGATERLQWLADTIERHKPDVVIIDNSSDVFAANENDRAAVRGFMRSLNTLAAHYCLAMLLLAHVDKASVRMGAGLDTDSTFSGSTAWNNSARSRWAMVRDGEAIALRHEKCNLGPRQDELRLEFDSAAKVFRRFGNGPASAAAAVLRNGHRAAIMKLLAAAERAGQRLSMSAQANNNAFLALKGSPDFPRIDRRAFFAMLFEMQRDGLVDEVEYTRENRTKAKQVVLTDAGKLRAASGSGAPAMWKG